MNLIISFLPYMIFLINQSSQSRNYWRSLDNFDLVKFMNRALKEKSIMQGSSSLIGTLEGCKDTVSWCSEYQRYCSEQSVSSYCQKTCKKCETSTQGSGQCVDKHPKCTKGVGYGYCTGSKQEIDFMKQNCQKSCNFCGSKCEDKQTAAYCYKIKSRNLCYDQIYESHFKEYCRATCRFCTPSCGLAKLREESVQQLDYGKRGVNSFSIVGGSTTTKGFYPWQVAIYNGNEYLCGGSLISETKVLTAAHCFNHRSRNVNEYTVVLGDHNRDFNEGTEQVVDLKKIIIHEDYSFKKDDNDIAVIILSKNARLSRYISIICLPKKDSELRKGAVCKLSGWGKRMHVGESATILQEADIPIADQKVCEKRNNFNYHKVTNKMICGGYDDGLTFISGCHGDSGGPLQCEVYGSWKLYGVVSWGSPMCNGLDRYTVFTKVSKYIDWIKDNN